MAVSIVVAVHDSALDAFSRPFFVPTTQIAVRSFTDEVNRAAEGNAMFAHPEDYVLFAIGEWDDMTGRFSNYEDAQMLVRAKDVSRKESVNG